MRRGAVFLTALALTGCVAGPETATPAPECRIGGIVDGDTFGLICNGGAEARVRLRNVDAPEVAQANCPGEREKGLVARDRLRQLVAEAPVSAVRYGGRLSDGRRLVDVEIGGKDLGRSMIAAGAARPFDGEAYPDWCAAE